jgi:hypothetical protein
MRDVLPASMYSRELDDAMVEDLIARMLEEHGLDARDLAELQEREPFFFLSKIFKIGCVFALRCISVNCPLTL